MAFLLRSLTVDKPLSAVEKNQVVDEVDISGPRLHLELRSRGDGLDGVESLGLTGSQRGQIGTTRMSFAPHKRCSAKVHNEFAVMIEENRTAFEARPAKMEVLKSALLDEISGAHEKKHNSS